MAFSKKFFLRIALVLVGLYSMAVFPLAVEASEAANVAVPSAKPGHLRIVTGPKGGQWFNIGEILAEILSTQVIPSTSRLGGGLDNIAQINNKNADLGFTLACFLGAAQSGEPEYKHILTENVSLLANVYPQVLYVLVRKEFADAHGIDSMEALLNKRIPLRFASLKPGTASEFILTMLLKHGYKTSFEQLKEQGWVLSFSDYAETADDFVDGSIDCFAYTAGTEVPLIRTLEEHTEAVILPVAPEILDILARKFKTSSYTIQRGDYKSIKTPIQTLGDAACIIVRKDLSGDFVFALAKAIWAGKSKIAKEVADFGQLNPEKVTVEGLGMHPGASLFWKTVKK